MSMSIEGVCRVQCFIKILGNYIVTKPIFSNVNYYYVKRIRSGEESLIVMFCHIEFNSFVHNWLASNKCKNKCLHHLKDDYES